jgi:hypothetical protein
MAASALAQPAPVTVGKAVEQALLRYPAIRSSTEQISAAAAAISLAEPRISLALTFSAN